MLNLSTLNGAHGFKLQGEATNDSSGQSVSDAGDVNGDGLADLLVSAAIQRLRGTGIASLTLGGSLVGGAVLFSGFVESVISNLDHVRVLAGYGDFNTPTNGHAQIGAISVGGDWIASSVTAGLLPNAAKFIFGDGDETFINAGAATNAASIASITIKGRAMGSLEAGDYFGIVAEHLGSVKIGGVKLALTSNPAPDIFAIGSTPDFFIREILR